MGPESWFIPKSRTLSFLNNPSSLGIVPSRLLPWRYSSCRKMSWPKLGARNPFTIAPERSLQHRTQPNVLDLSYNSWTQIKKWGWKAQEKHLQLYNMATIWRTGNARPVARIFNLYIPIWKNSFGVFIYLFFEGFKSRHWRKVENQERLSHELFIIILPKCSNLI